MKPACFASIDLTKPISSRMLRGKPNTWYRCTNCGAVCHVIGPIDPKTDGLTCGAEIGVNSCSQWVADQQVAK